MLCVVDNRQAQVPRDFQVNVNPFLNVHRTVCVKYLCEHCGICIILVIQLDSFSRKGHEYLAKLEL